MGATLFEQTAEQAPLQRVHHSYIWLKSLSAFGSIVFALVIVNASALLSAIQAASHPSTASFTVLLSVAGGILFLLVVLGVLIGATVLTYRNLYYQVNPSEFILYSGVIKKRQVHIPYQRIQSVDQQATLLERIFGVGTVVIDTAGGASNKSVRVPCLRKSQADLLRKELFGRKHMLLQAQVGACEPLGAAAGANHAGSSCAARAESIPSEGYSSTVSVASASASELAPGVVRDASEQANVLDAPADFLKSIPTFFGGEAQDMGEVSYEFGLTNKELFFTGVFNSLPVVGALLVGLAGALSVLIDFVSAWNIDVPRLLVVQIVPLVGVLVFIVLLSALSTCVSYGGFHARRRGSRIEVEQGLLQHVIQGVEIDRVQSVRVKQNIAFRLLGYCQISLGRIEAVDEASRQQQKQTLSRGLVVHPFVKMDQVPEILAGLVPEYVDLPAKDKRLPKVAFRRALIRRSIIQGAGFYITCVSLVLLGIMQVFSSSFDGGSLSYEVSDLSLMSGMCTAGIVMGILLLTAETVGAIMWYRGSSLAYNERFMRVTNAGWTRTTVSFSRQKIQFGTVKTNPFQRRAKTATVIARTAEGIGGTNISLVDMTDQEAHLWLAWLKPKQTTTR